MAAVLADVATIALGSRRGNVTDPRPGQDWLRWEIDLVVAAYFSVLEAQLRGQPVVKADVRRDLERLLPARTGGSVEYKLRNISAILEQARLTFVDGYTPAHHVQSDLRGAVLDWTARHPAVSELMEQYGNEPPPTEWRAPRLEDVLVPAPLGRLRGSRVPLGVSRGWWGALQDAQNRRLGEAGENWVVDIERAELHAAGRDDLAHRVEWTSRVHGDGFGYDVASFRRDGASVQIEVKTTNLGPRSPFYITRHELSVSEELAQSYRLYRVFEFARAPRLFVLNGSVNAQLALAPLAYEARLLA
jgi:hypothetical protein